MAKISTLSDAFTAATINTSLWNLNTGGAVTLDTVNDLIVLAHPTVNGAVNTFGTSTTYDATNSAIYAEVGPAANGNGFTRTIFKVVLDASNSVAIRLISGVLNLTLQTAGTTVTTQIATTYDPNAHGWWRLRESGGSWNADTSADGLNWTTLFTTAYSWSAAAVSFVFQTSAGTTEVAGNVATIQRINTLAQCGPFNVNWPILEEAWAPYWNSNGGDIPLDHYVNLTPRTQGESSTQRGVQYELDQVQAGTATIIVQNNDGVLDPDNAAGPYAGRIQPAQPYRKRAQWPPTRNLLTQVQATGGDLGGVALGALNATKSGPGIFTGTDPAHGSLVASGTAWQGGTAMQFSVPSGTASGQFVVFTQQPALVPGRQYSLQMQVRNVTAATTVQVAAYLSSNDATHAVISQSTGSTATLTGSASAPWTQVTVTGTTSASMVYANVALVLTASPGATVAVQVDGWQLEQAATPSTWACPGVWLPWATGYTDEWAAQWSMGGTYGTITPTVYDTFGLLSQKKLLDSLTQEINSHSPRFLYQLDDPAGSAAATDATGQSSAAPLANSKYGAGAAAFGTAVTAASPTTGAYTGSAGTVLTLTNPNPGASGNQASTFLSLSAAGIKGPANPLLWSRMIAFRYTGPTPSDSADLWVTIDASHSAGSNVSIYINNTGHLAWSISGPSSGATGAATSFTVTDSNWHLAIVAYDGANSGLNFIVDGALIGAYSISSAYAPTGLVGDNVGTFVDSANGNSTTDNFKGDLSFVAEFPVRLSPTDGAGIYTAWKTACAGESTNARYSRILRYAGYIGVSALQSGLTTSMGPAAFSGQDALSALQDVVTTENGAHFVDRAGTVTFQARSNRYNATVPVYTFGERTDLGEWPYENAAPTRDTAHLANDVEVTQSSTGQLFSASNAVAQTNYMPKTLTRSINSSSAGECQDAANYLLSRYVNPVTRIQALKLHPSANPALWPVCLSLELGMRVRVMRRPPGAPAIQVDCFVEKIDTSNGDDGEAFWTLQCSPVDSTPYGVLAAFHTTLNATISSGVGSVTIKNGADNTNTAASQLGIGQQLVLGQNTANQETVTIKAVAATSPGWTTCVITLVSNTTKGHTAGDVVCEPLPAGVTDPTTWDKVSMFDSIAFAY